MRCKSCEHASSRIIQQKELQMVIFPKIKHSNINTRKCLHIFFNLESCVQLILRFESKTWSCVYALSRKSPIKIQTLIFLIGYIIYVNKRISYNFSFLYGFQYLLHWPYLLCLKHFFWTSIVQNRKGMKHN